MYYTVAGTQLVRKERRKQRHVQPELYLKVVEGE
jgi:hypothetical protein